MTRSGVKRSLLVMAVLIITFGVFGVWRLSDFDLDHHAQETFQFTEEGIARAGTLWLPDTPALAAVVLVHGDGPQDRLAEGGLTPMVNTLLDAGIAVASWDKPGIGGSAGDWLNQSMADRATETRAALRTLRTALPDIPVGALGFSQAGWVLPKLTEAEADFLVLIGSAVSWQAQGRYFARIRLGRAGYSASKITAELAEQAREDELLFGPTAKAPPPGMSRGRWNFIRRNRFADARPDLSRLTLPVLALWGADDLNVDARIEADSYRALIGNVHGATQIALLPNATHGLLKSGAYNWQLPSQWSRWAKVRYLFEARNAYVPGALKQIADWITNRSVVSRPGR